MAATRKLQGEIDRCLKKVSEGVETFEDIWQKVHNATNSNQKEKYEADLKKEIKKLQRLRDQIKSWIANPDIKDKNALLENRRLIETQMERFKVVERETKTKAYSKEGLGAAQKLDPAQRERDELRKWLKQSISNLQIKIEQNEVEIESLLAVKKKKVDKDKQDRIICLRSKLERHKFHMSKLETLLRMLDNDTVDINQVRSIQEDVDYYIESSHEADFKENEYIYDDISGIDDIELSGPGLPSATNTDSNNSNETGDSPSSINSGTTSPVQSPPLSCSNNAISAHNHSSDSGAVDYTSEKRSENDSVNIKVTPIKPTALRVTKADVIATSSGINSLTMSAAKVVTSIVSSTPSKNLASGQQVLTRQQSITAATPPSSVGKTPSSIFSPTVTSTVTPSVSTPTGIAVSSSTIPSTAPIAFAAVAKNNSYSLSSTTASPISAVTTTTTNSQSKSLINNYYPLTSQYQPIYQQNSNNTQPITSNSLENSNSLHHNSNNIGGNGINNSSMASLLTNCVPTSNSITNNRVSPNLLSPKQQLLNGPSAGTSLKNSSNLSSSTETLSTLKTMAQDAINRAGLESSSTSGSMGGGTQQPQLPQNLPQQPPSESRQPLFSESTAINGPIQTQQTVQMKQGTNEANIPPLLGVAPLGPTPLQKEHQLQFVMMEAAYSHLPTPSDSEKLRPYFGRQPVPTPPHYPQTQLPHSDTIDFFSRLTTETLFFVFYYMEGTKAQYLAAKALKRQGWRFHTKYMVWFQRHEEPKIINEEYEQGTYICFDYEEWAQRKREGFTFEYRYLEDRDLN